MKKLLLVDKENEIYCLKKQPMYIVRILFRKPQDLG
jgi:hypothetical protein